MSKYNQEVKLAILSKAFGFLLTEEQQILLEAWTDTSKYHKQVAENWSNPEWVREQIENTLDYPVDQEWLKNFKARFKSVDDDTDFD